MKPIALVLVSLAFATSASASAPELFPIQGLLTDAQGKALEGPVTVTFALYDSVDATTAIWTEQRTGVDEVDVTQGYFSVYLGEIEPLEVTALGQADELWFGLTIEDDVEMPRVQFASVPYALLAQDVVGDIHPETVTVGGVMVIDEQGRWVGESGGLQGPAGPKGDKGDPGDVGAAGAAGADGAPGVAGAKGDKGDTGDAGAQGVPGAPGIKGDKGDDGSAGADGDSVVATSLDVGDTVCAYGGAMFTAGLVSTYACNGLPGEVAGQGPPGADGESVIAQSIGPTTECPNGGSAFTVAEVTTYACNGAAGAVGAQGVKGDKGDKGDTGDAGVQGVPGTPGTNGAPGTNGTNGTPGTNGKTILSGTVDPAVATGTSGDFYLNTFTSTLFGPKTGAGWATGTSLVGPQGATGNTGAQGTPGTPGTNGTNGAQGTAGTNGKTILSGAVDPAVATGTTGDFYVNTATMTFFGPKTGAGWATGTGLVGAQGAPGAAGANGTNGTNGADGRTVSSGTTVPVGTLGNNGDFYLRTTNSQLYGPKTAGAWGSGVSLVGAQGTPGTNGTNGIDGAPGAQGTAGAAGANGKTVLNGAGTPSGTLGVAGDFYIDTTNRLLFGPKTGVWGAGVSMVGPQGTPGTNGTNGAPGAQGTAGTAGVDGRTVLNGTTVPATTLGNNGDFYLRTTTSQLYGPKTGGNNWGTPVSLVGPQGTAGTNGSNGADGAPGAQGTAGTAGVDGRTVLNGTTVPATTLGNNGDFYLRTTTSQLYGPKTGGNNWGAPVSLVGPQGTAGTNGSNGADGAPGAQGTAGTAGVDGRTVLNGTTVPATTLGNNGDFYLRTTTSQLYGPKTGGNNWGTPVSLVGPQGTAGTNGTNGADGAPGAQGTAGTAGVDGRTVLNGTTVPATTLGNNGDFYLRTTTSQLYGPKTGGNNWGTPVSLVGPQGPPGTNGTNGAAGPSGIAQSVNVGYPVSNAEGESLNKTGASEWRMVRNPAGNAGPYFRLDNPTSGVVFNVSVTLQSTQFANLIVLLNLCYASDPTGTGTAIKIGGRDDLLRAQLVAAQPRTIQISGIVTGAAPGQYVGPCYRSQDDLLIFGALGSALVQP